MKKLSYVLGLTLFLSGGYLASAQETVINGYNPNSVRPVHESKKMFKKILWWRMDLKEKQNLPFFSRNGEITKLIIEAVKSDLLIPYVDDSLNKRMSKEVFLENLKIPDEGGDALTPEEIAAGFGQQQEDDPFGNPFGGGGTEEEVAVVDEFGARDYTILEIKEEMFFDKLRSRMYHDIQAINIWLPADKNPAGFEKQLSSFKYKDLVELFRKMPEEALWYNTQNFTEHKNFADAFQLRLFSANLIKYANPKDQLIVDIYGSNKRSVIESQKLEYELIEFENELWEF
ncbi:MAG: gliding motility protein GldN [Cyclobacteriaceae bacterium]